MAKKKTILYVDGENFLFKVADILKANKNVRYKYEITQFSFAMLCETALSEHSVDDRKYYAAKVHFHDDTPELAKKSNQIIESQRRLKRNLTNDGTSFISSGNVRLQDIIPATRNSPVKYIFKEKGTDVQLAVGILSDVCDGNVSTVLILSSDSDMQPVVREVKRRGGRIVYVGFEDKPNVGLSNSCHQTILLRKKEIIDAWKGPQPPLNISNYPQVDKKRS